MDEGTGFVDGIARWLLASEYGKSLVDAKGFDDFVVIRASQCVAVDGFIAETMGHGAASCKPIGPRCAERSFEGRSLIRQQHVMYKVLGYIIDLRVRLRQRLRR